MLEARDNFPTKGHGRIYCKTQEDVEKVKKIIKAMDSFEYGYLPDDLITCEIPRIGKNFNGKQCYMLDLAYTHKFDDLDLNELRFRCFLEDINIAIWNQNDDYNHDDWDDYAEVSVVPGDLEEIEE